MSVLGFLEHLPHSFHTGTVHRNSKQATICRAQGACKPIMMVNNISRRVRAALRCHSSRSGLLSVARRVATRQLRSPNSLLGML
jgi:hypothetical protein